MALKEGIEAQDVLAWALSRVGTAFELRRIGDADGDERTMARAAGQAGAFMEVVRYLDDEEGKRVHDEWTQLIGISDDDKP
ncbi:hypothetical protein ASG84_01945 [Rhodococcus sp. Leaf278]|uniref:hypothetical protein n=1 Tax=Rhodococcus sp. Leaf278 TaxID=1736319 RepID=UPI00070D84C0|nr:hypothetical protein [Rhodococcus sp. Leaf278]KQU61300.1 hypothetical protein ASG84_01945 [Rhodococcus sp. Leaf278]